VKQRLFGSIAVIASVDALAWYLDLEKETNTLRLMWVALFPLMLADRIARRPQLAQSAAPNHAE
jgi:hypothetical protein